MTPHGTISRYVNDACRCKKCRKAKAEYQRGLKGKPPLRHGTYNSWKNRGCRCEACVLVGKRYVRDVYHSNFGTAPPSHGRSGYNNYGCRCDVCSAATLAYQRARRQRVSA